MTERNPSLYETLLQHYAGDLGLHQVREEDQQLLSVLDNLRRILNTRAGSIAHLPGYGLPDLGTVFQGLPGSAHSLMRTLADTLLRYEPRLAAIEVGLRPQQVPGYLDYTLQARLHSGEQVTFGTTLVAEGNVVVRHLRQQGYLPAR